jgi:aryl-alcohol dehydrogenase-like predicted oxidoreductase
MIPPTHFGLAGGTKMPSRGFGTFQPDPAIYPPGSVKRSVLAALQAGCRHIDTSLRYGDGQGEREVGEAVKESGIPRDEIFIVTKLCVATLPLSNPTPRRCLCLTIWKCRTRENVFHQPEDVEVGMDMSLKNLGMDYGGAFLGMKFPINADERISRFIPHALYVSPRMLALWTRLTSSEYSSVRI